MSTETHPLRCLIHIRRVRGRGALLMIESKVYTIGVHVGQAGLGLRHREHLLVGLIARITVEKVSINFVHLCGLILFN
jgi:hypothetical protein